MERPCVLGYPIGMRLDVLTLFPAMFQGPLTESILQRARDNKLLDIRLHDIREFSTLNHRQVDDKPYGGGAGMVMRADVLVNAIEAVSGAVSDKRLAVSGERRAGSGEQTTHHSQLPASSSPYRIYLSPRGKRLTQSKVESLAKKRDWILLLCGHYEGIDQRVIDGWIDEEISIGDYVLTGGELPAMVLIDALARHIPGVLGKNESAADESFSKSLGRKREYPHYTRPEEFRGMKVPDVLIGGHHAKIGDWRRSKLK